MQILIYLQQLIEKVGFYLDKIISLEYWLENSLLLSIIYLI